MTAWHMPRFGRCSRRALLRTGLGALFLAPLLRQRELLAQATAPKRLILAFTPNSHPREWWPTPYGANGFTLRGPLLDFVGLEPHLLFVRQLDHGWTSDNHHQAGMAQLFTGQRFSDDTTRYAAGPSIEQVLLARTDLRGGTPVRDVHIAVGDQGGGEQRHVTCYSGPGQPIPHEPSSARVFSELFEGVSFDGGTAPISEQALSARVERAVLAIDADEIRRMQTFLGQDERERLDLHLTALAELGDEVARRAENPTVVAPSGCQKVDVAGQSSSDRDAASIDAWSSVTIELIANGFACDRTRVVDLAYGASGSQHAGMFGLDYAPANSWHDVAHRMQDDVGRAERLEAFGEESDAASAFTGFDRFWASQLAKLARRLDAIPEGDGSMLDNTLIYWGVETGTDHNHGPADIPYLLIGGRNLGFQSGQLLTFPTPQSVHQLHTSVLHAFGDTEAQGFGIEPSCGPLSGVLG
jgi:hypothetical protein